jgi:hypothetical protein
LKERCCKRTSLDGLNQKGTSLLSQPPEAELRQDMWQVADLLTFDSLHTTLNRSGVCIS